VSEPGGELINLMELLTLAGVEIEAIETRGAKIDKVVVAQITASSPHPNADRLTVCEVDDGSGTKRQIVCGATNYKVDDKVPLALPGAVLPSRREAEGGFQIKVTKMRGIDSEGMLCSAIERQSAARFARCGFVERFGNSEKQTARHRLGRNALQRD